MTGNLGTDNHPVIANVIRYQKVRNVIEMFSKAGSCLNFAPGREFERAELAQNRSRLSIENINKILM